MVIESMTIEQSLYHDPFLRTMVQRKYKIFHPLLENLVEVYK